MDDELLHSFQEDSRENLESIEGDLMDLEAAGEAFEDDLVNRIFRTAHSIKGAAGFLGLEQAAGLAHVLENLLHLVRERRLIPSRKTVDAFMRGFDALGRLVDNPLEEAEEGLEGLVAELEGMYDPEARDLAHTDREIGGGDGPVFTVDDLTLEEALKGGKFLYLVEYDLIHDVHRKDKTPYDVIRAMLDSGYILDSKVDLEAAGDLKSGFGNSIPFHVLYATIIDPEIVSMLFDVPEGRVRLLDRESVRAGEPPRWASGTEPHAGVLAESIAGLEVAEEDGAAVVRAGEELTLDTVENLRQALLRASESRSAVRLDVSDANRADFSFAQLVVSALRHQAECGGDFGFTGEPPEPVAACLRRAGLDRLLGEAT
ncbi:STAS domain-containing protein [Desulfohalovibrio reitneri]|uniref:STAS domain-containing protein n=1 Tax=Desulfohalovibrio reitneri TaxID=1307759 RepID=UPI0006910206|nr:STAS domain-containing protein [Desulfohalovibrio reitneri]